MRSEKESKYFWNLYERKKENENWIKWAIKTGYKDDFIRKLKIENKLIKDILFKCDKEYYLEIKEKKEDVI